LEQSWIECTFCCKAGLYTLQQNLVAKSIGKLSGADTVSLESSLRDWLGLK
jgi:hypothetical protein